VVVFVRIKEKIMTGRKPLTLDIMMQRATRQRSLMFSLLIMGALIAFEIFNYSTTDFAMSDLLGDLKFAGLRWSTILALAFCGIDFAGIARLFTPEQGKDEPAEVWYLFGAWLLAATMNALLTWWGVSIAILQHQSLGNALISRDALLKSVPIFVAVIVWLSRVLIIGTFSVAGENLFIQADQRVPVRTPSVRKTPTLRKAPKPQSAQPAVHARPSYSRYSPAPKPTRDDSYQQMPMSVKTQEANNNYHRYA
jgi:hypothetical protein